MNVFKGLLYLVENDPPAAPALIDAPRYGAATAAGQFGETLGNRAAAQRRFGARLDRAANEEARLDAVGGCR